MASITFGAGSNPPAATSETTRLDRLAGWLIDQAGLSAILVAISTTMLFVWIPGYLRWPFWVDPDVFAVLAQAWAEGVVPYRDILSYNYPGQIYLFRALHFCFGPGNTAPFYALDAALVVGLGVAMVGWSRRMFGRILPGLVGYLGFLSYYLNLAFDEVAQREWHGAFCAVIGLLAYQCWPGRWGRLASAFGIACGLTFRPHIVLFLPAVLSAIDEERRNGEAGPVSLARLTFSWTLGFVGCLALVFAPLILAGTLDDMVLAIRYVFYNASYSELPPLLGMRVPRFVHAFVQLVTQLASLRYSAILAVLLLLALRDSGATRRGLVRTWLIAGICLLCYKPMHPRWWVASLIQPFVVVWSIQLALVVHYVLKQRSVPASVRLGLTLILLGLCGDGIPRMVSLSQAKHALVAVRGGSEDGGRVPLGYSAYFPRPLLPWADYQEAVRYLKRQTSPSTEVASLVFPAAINGPSGRRSPFRREGGVMWLHFVAPGDEPEFLASMERSADSVVVWEPEDDRLSARFKQGVRTLYRPEARFGSLEIGRRVPVRVARQD